MPLRRQLLAVRHVWRTEGPSSAIGRTAQNFVRPAYYRDRFYATSVAIDYSLVTRTPGTRARGFPVEDPAELADLRPLMHDDLPYEYVEEFLSSPLRTRRFAFLTKLTDRVDRPIIGYYIAEQGRFSIESYGFGGPLPETMLMGSDTEIVPEYRGQGLWSDTEADYYRFIEALGVEREIGVIRTHNVASLRSGFRKRPGRVQGIHGEFAITSWLGGRIVRTPRWEDVRSALLSPPISRDVPAHARATRR